MDKTAARIVRMCVIVDPLETRRVVEFALDAATAYKHREHLTIETIE